MHRGRNGINLIRKFHPGNFSLFELSFHFFLFSRKLDCQRNRMKENRQVSKVFIFILEKLHCYEHFHTDFYWIDR